MMKWCMEIRWPQSMKPEDAGHRARRTFAIVDMVGLNPDLGYTDAGQSVLGWFTDGEDLINTVGPKLLAYTENEETGERYKFGEPLDLAPPYELSMSKRSYREMVPEPEVETIECEPEEVPGE